MKANFGHNLSTSHIRPHNGGSLVIANNYNHVDRGSVGVGMEIAKANLLPAGMLLEQLIGFTCV